MGRSIAICRCISFVGRIRRVLHPLQPLEVLKWQYKEREEEILHMWSEHGRPIHTRCRMVWSAFYASGRSFLMGIFGIGPTNKI